jgi:hypothetical protein
MFEKGCRKKTLKLNSHWELKKLKIDELFAEFPLKASIIHTNDTNLMKLIQSFELFY